MGIVVLASVIFLILYMIVLDFKYDKVDAVEILKSKRNHKKHHKKGKK